MYDVSAYLIHFDVVLMFMFTPIALAIGVITSHKRGTWCHSLRVAVLLDERTSYAAGDCTHPN